MLFLVPNRLSAKFKHSLRPEAMYFADFDFEPYKLLKGEDKGAVFTPQMKYLYQSTDTSTPVTTIGQSVARINSPNGVAWVQSTSTARMRAGRMPQVGVTNLLASIGAQNTSLTTLPWVSSPALSTTFRGTGSQAVLTANFGGDANATRVQLALNGGTTSNDRSGFSIPLFTFPALGSWTVSVKVKPNGSTSAAALQAAFTNANNPLGAIAAGGTITASTWVDNGDGTYTSTRTASATIDGSLRFQLWGTGGTDALDFIIYNDTIQLTQGSTAAPAQRVASAWDVTQEGTPDTAILYSDLGDDAYSLTLPAGDYSVAIAGEKGIFFDRVTHAGGAFSIGPTTWTGGPTGAMTQLVGNRIIEAVVRDREFTSAEQEQLTRRWMALGAPGVWERGVNLWTDPAGVMVSSWTYNGDGSYTHDGTAGIQSLGSNLGSGEAPVGAVWLLEFKVSEWTAGNVRLRIYDSSQFIFDTATASSVGWYRGVGLAGPTTASFANAIRFLTGGGFAGTIHNMSVHRLTLNPSPL